MAKDIQRSPHAPVQKESSGTGQRTPQQVLDSHLDYSKRGTADEDLRLNYAPDIVMLTGIGTYRGYSDHSLYRPTTEVDDLTRLLYKSPVLPPTI